MEDRHGSRPLAMRQSFINIEESWWLCVDASGQSNTFQRNWNKGCRVTLVNVSLRVHRLLAGSVRVLALGLAVLRLSAQETPRPNRVAWFEGFPEPLPEGVKELTLEATSQMLRPDLQRSGDGRSYARLDGEEWQLTGDWATQAARGSCNVRARLASRSGGIADQAIWNWHQFFGMPQGGQI